jgi:undecaprenyl-diphosphatase
MEIDLSRWDWELMVYLNNLSPDALDSFWVFVTYTKHWTPLYILLILIFFYKTSFRKGTLGVTFLLASAGTAHLLTELVKPLVSRLRPNNTDEIMHHLKVLYEPTNFSFFSGHASTSFATVVFVYITLKFRFQYLGLIFIWPVLFSISRIFVGVHFPSDVFVGAFVGSIIGIMYSKIYFQLDNRGLSVGNQDNA